MRMRPSPLSTFVKIAAVCLTFLVDASLSFAASDCSTLFLESKEPDVASRSAPVEASLRQISAELTYKLAKDPVPAIEEIYKRRFAAEEKKQPDRFLMAEYFNAPLREILRMLEAQVVPPEMSSQAAELIGIGKLLLLEGSPYGPTLRFLRFAADQLVYPGRPYNIFARRIEGQDDVWGTPDLPATIFTGFRYHTGLIVSGRTLDQLIADRNQILLPSFDKVPPRRINRLRETPFKVIGLRPIGTKYDFYNLSSFMLHDIGHTATLSVKDEKAFPTPNENAVFLQALVGRAQKGLQFLDLVKATFNGGDATLADGFIYLRTHEQDEAMKNIRPFMHETDPENYLKRIAYEGIQIPTDSPRPASERWIEVIGTLMDLHQRVYGVQTSQP